MKLTVNSFLLCNSQSTSKLLQRAGFFCNAPFKIQGYAKKKVQKIGLFSFQRCQIQIPPFYQWQNIHAIFHYILVCENLIWFLKIIFHFSLKLLQDVFLL